MYVIVYTNPSVQNIYPQSIVSDLLPDMRSFSISIVQVCMNPFFFALRTLSHSVCFKELISRTKNRFTVLLKCPRK